jgi:hypothetical protein
VTFIYPEVLRYETRIVALNREILRLNDIIGKDMPCLVAELEAARAMIAKLKAEHACQHGTTCVPEEP